MQQVWQFPERTMRLVRWLLLIGWIALIILLRVPTAGLSSNARCSGAAFCQAAC